MHRSAAHFPLPPASSRIFSQWRFLTGGSSRRDHARRTLVACSGGADSSALLIALAARKPSLVTAAYIRHDLRDHGTTSAELCSVQALAQRLRTPFLTLDIHVRGLPGNSEANARRARYHALASLAQSHNLPFVATAHHGDDLAESILMRLLRGAGPAGLAALAPARPLAPAVTLVRPMLSLTRADAHAICAAFNHLWCDDATNRDTSRLRAALRAQVLPHLHALAPGYQERLLHTRDALAHAGDLINLHARRLLEPQSPHFCIARDAARAASPVVLGAAIRIAGGSPDRGSRALRQALDFIRSPSGETRRFRLAALAILVTRDRVRLTPTAPSAELPPPPSSAAAAADA